jgi:predicted acylesterase/phospholipase RssA
MTRDGGCALVLSGGAAYAAYEIGVMRALMTGASPATGYTRLTPDVITGTSAGSVNAALFASAPADDALESIDYVENVWRTRIAERAGECMSTVIRLRANLFGLFNPACFAADSSFGATFVSDVAYLWGQWARRSDAFFRSTHSLRQRFIEAFDLATFISGEPLREVLSETLHPERIRHSPRCIRIAATNWRTGELRVFDNEDMDERHALLIVLASSAIPGVFGSVDIDGEPYVDGGVVMNTPLRPAIQAGADQLHVIYMDPDVLRIPLPRVRNTMNTFYRMLVISFGLTVSRDIATASAINRRVQRGEAAVDRSVLTGAPRPTDYRPLTIHRYQPSDDLGGTFRWLEFDGEHVHRLIQRGYDDACAHDCAVSRCVFPGDEHADTVERDRRLLDRG